MPFPHNSWKVGNNKESPNFEFDLIKKFEWSLIVFSLTVMTSARVLLNMQNFFVTHQQKMFFSKTFFLNFFLENFFSPLILTTFNTCTFFTACHSFCWGSRGIGGDGPGRDGRGRRRRRRGGQRGGVSSGMDRPLHMRRIPKHFAGKKIRLFYSLFFLFFLAAPVKIYI